MTDIRFRVHQAKGGGWYACDPDQWPDECEMFARREHAKIEAYVLNEYHEYKGNQKIDNKDIDRLALWYEVVRVMRERGMVV